MNVYIVIVIIILCLMLYLLIYPPFTPKREGFGFFKKIVDFFNGFKRIGKLIANIFERPKFIFQGVMLGGKGVGISIKNTAIMGGLFIQDSFVYAYEGAAYIYQNIVCSIDKMKNFRSCFLFYLLDIILYLIHIIIASSCALMDAIFNLKSKLGTTLLKAYLEGLKSIKEADRMIYSMTGIHITTYPDVILNMCYRCVASTEKIDRAEEVITDDLKRKFPALTDEFVRIFNRAGKKFKRAFAPIRV